MQREELLTMAQISEESGSIDRNESQFFYNLMHLRTMRVCDIMTPRPVMYALDEKTTLEDFVKRAVEVPFTRIPVYDGNSDEMTGLVLRGEVLMALVKNDGRAKTLADVKRPVTLTQEFIHLDVLFNRFISEKQHFMLVADEFGTNVGLVTLEDLIETIFGIEIVDERDKVTDMQEHARRLWRERAEKMGITLPEMNGEASSSDSTADSREEKSVQESGNEK
jgi:CBS domain containing-hemolysin-like protein